MLVKRDDFSMEDSMEGAPFDLFVFFHLDFKVWVVTPNLPPHLIAKKLIAFFGSSSRFLEAHRVWTHNGSFFTFARWFFLKLSWKLNDNPPDVF